MAVGPNNAYPSLETVMNLFRSVINDDGAGQTGITGGQIATDNAPFTLPYLNAGIRWLYSKMRNINHRTLILDNYIVEGLPVVASPQGTPDPTRQVALTSIGFFDGVIYWPNFLLPANCIKIERVWERLANSGTNFVPVTFAPSGLPPVMQVESFGYYELRQDSLWFPGALTSRDIRLRCTVQFTPLSGPNIDFNNTYIPVYDCERVVVGEMLHLYAIRFAPEQVMVAKDYRDEAKNDLLGEEIYVNQGAENSRADWGGDDQFFPWGTEL
jgi:hypothetical protein